MRRSVPQADTSQDTDTPTRTHNHFHAHSCDTQYSTKTVRQTCLCVVAAVPRTPLRKCEAARTRHSPPLLPSPHAAFVRRYCVNDKCDLRMQMKVTGRWLRLPPRVYTWTGYVAEFEETFDERWHPGGLGLFCFWTASIMWLVTVSHTVCP